MAVATVFGVISPKIKINSVIIPVAIATPEPPNSNEYTIVVVNAEAERFTMLFPIRIALSNFEGFSVILITVFARLFPSSAKERILILFTVVKHVSADEKKADNNNKIISTITCTIVPCGFVAALGSTYKSLLCFEKINIYLD